MIRVYFGKDFPNYLVLVYMKVRTPAQNFNFIKHINGNLTESMFSYLINDFNENIPPPPTFKSKRYKKDENYNFYDTMQKFLENKEHHFPVYIRKNNKWYVCMDEDFILVELEN